MQLSPFWTDDFPRPADLETSPLPDAADVAIVGAGVTGLAAARRLAKGGASVTVLDEGRVGAGASTISGGMTIYGMKAGTRHTIREHGRALGLELWQASLDCIDLVEKIVSEEGIDCHFRRTGAVELGYHQRDLSAFAEESEWMEREVGFSTRLVAPDRMDEVIGSERFVAALVDEFSGGLHPARYTYGLAAAAARAGARLVEHAEVLGITAEPSGFVLRTALGSMRAGEVVVATNGYTGGLLPGLQRRIVPIGSYIVVTEPLSAELAQELIPGERMMWTARRFINYFRLTPDRRLLMGGRQNLSTSLDWTHSADVLRRTILEVYPQLREVEITHSWSGNVGASFDLHPHIERFGGVWAAGGYSGHGMATGTYVGDELGGLISGELTRSPYCEIPWKGRWYYRRTPWFLPAAAVLYRTLDRFGR